MFLGRQRGLPVLRRRHDPRRRGRRARLAHRPARDALASSATGSTRAACRSSAACATATTASRASGARSSTASCAARRSRPSLAGGLLVALAAPGAAACTRSTRASPGLPRDLPIMQTYDRIQAAFPGGPLPGGRRRPGRRRDRARRCTAGIRDAARPRAWPTGLDARAGHDRQTARPARSRVVNIPLAGDGTDDALRSARSPTLRDDVIPRDARHGRRRRGQRDRHDRRLERLQRRDEVARCRSSSRSCSALAFLLLLVTFRSIVIPIKAIVLNLLSVGAAYGVLVLSSRTGTSRRCSASTSIGGDHLVAAAVPVRDPVRPVDGLPRVHPQPDPRGGRPRHEHRATRSRTASSRRPASSRARRS